MTQEQERALSLADLRPDRREGAPVEVFTGLLEKTS